MSAVELARLTRRLKADGLTVVESPSYVTVVGREVLITVEPRPSYCDRGRWIAQAWPSGEFTLEFDNADGFPRYYFGTEACASELREWLKARGRLLPTETEEAPCRS